MITHILKRIANTSKGMFGVWIDENNLPYMVSLEPSWMENLPNVSCVPPGTYEVALTQHPVHGLCYQIMNVPDGRSDVLIHIGNIIADTLGCDMVGQTFGPVKGSYGIQNSTVTYDMFMKKMAGVEKFTLRIIDATS